MSLSKENDADFEFFRNSKFSLDSTSNNRPFWAQKVPKEAYQCFEEFYQNYFVVHERSAVKNVFSTYVWSKVDSCVCEFLYLFPFIYMIFSFDKQKNYFCTLLKIHAVVSGLSQQKLKCKGCVHSRCSWWRRCMTARYAVKGRRRTQRPLGKGRKGRKGQPPGCGLKGRLGWDKTTFWGRKRGLERRNTI